MGGCRRGPSRTAAVMLFGVVLSAIAGCSGAGQTAAVPDDEEWIRTQDDSSQVSVELPGTAQMQTQEIPDQTGETMPARLWLVELGDNAASVGFMVADVQGRSIDLAGGLEGIATSVSGSVAQQSEASQDGHEAIDGVITFTQSGVDGSVHARVIDGGENMVILQSVGARDDDATLEQLQTRLVDSVTMP